MSFIYKYKPIWFGDYEHHKQETIDVVKYLIEINSLNILCIGDNTCGKTVLLNSIVREYLKQYGVGESTHVLRLNHVKEQGVQYFRNDLRFFCQNISSTKKLVVIDDIDVITEQGQQILGHCIDNYSNTTNFIASCSNTHKVINEIQTTLLTVTIPRVSAELRETLFRRVVEAEKILLTDEGADFVLTTSHNINSMLNILQKCKLYTSECLDKSTLTTLICNINVRQFDSFTSYLKGGDVARASAILLDLYETGYSVIDILDSYFAYVSATQLYSDEEKYKVVKVITDFTAIFHVIHEDSIELPIFVHNLVKIWK